MTDGEYGADYTFEATGLVAVMQQALEATRMAWGLCTVAGVAGKGETLDVVPRLLITGRRIAGSSSSLSTTSPSQRLLPRSPRRRLLLRRGQGP